MLRPDVEQMDVSALKTWAAAVRAVNCTVMEQLDNGTRFFRDTGRDWQGKAYNAAYDRVLQDHDEARKVRDDIDAMLEALDRDTDNVSSYRTVLLNKVGDAEHAGFRVDDSWKVTGGHDKNEAEGHQGLIDQAKYGSTTLSKTSNATSAKAASWSVLPVACSVRTSTWPRP